MTTTAPTRQPKGTPTGGQFATQFRTEDSIALGIAVGDTQAPITAAEARAIVDNGFAQIDAAWLEADSTDDLIDNGTSSGAAHAHAEVIASLLHDDLDDADTEAAAEELLDSRREGIALETQPGWDGPGELTAVRRQMIVDRCRRRANEMFEAAQNHEDVPDVAAWFYGRYETFEEAALDLSANGAFYTGEENR